MRRRLAGKVAVVTGGASGMGLSTVERFVAEGAKVVFCDLAPQIGVELDARLGPLKASMHHRDREKGGDHDGWTIAERLGSAAHFVPADVTERSALEGVVHAAVERYGGLDIMFNNAGVCAAEGSIVDCPEEVFDRTIDVDIKAVWLGIKIAAPFIIERGGGAIISTASVAGLSGFRGMGAYTAAKGGVIALTRAAAVELAPHHIRVNCICPGTIVTPIAATILPHFDADVMRAAMASGPPIPRSGEGEDIAATALWLASDDSSFVTGQVIAVDGGGTIEYDARTRGASVGERLETELVRTGQTGS